MALYAGFAPPSKFPRPGGGQPYRPYIDPAAGGGKGVPYYANIDPAALTATAPSGLTAGGQDSFSSLEEMKRYFGLENYNPNPAAAAAPAAPTAGATMPASATAPPAYWRPAALGGSSAAGGGDMQRYRTDADDKRRAARMGGGGGGGFGGSYLAVEPSTSQGSGGYWPGHQAEFAAQMQMAMMNPYVAAAHQNQPAAQAALYQAQWNANSPAQKRAFARAGLGPPGGGGGGYGGSGGLAGDFQSAFDEAREANESRYKDTLSGAQARYERNMETLRGMGAQEARDINEAYTAQEAARRQSLTGRGLSNSTIVDTMQMGNERERTAELGRLNERLRQQQVATDADLSGDVLGIMERRTDSYPDYAQLERLAQQMGAAGVGQAGGAGTGGVTGYQMSMTPANSGLSGYQMPAFYAMPSGPSDASLARLAKSKAVTADRVTAIRNLMARGLSEHQARLVLGGGFDVRDFL